MILTIFPAVCVLLSLAKVGLSQSWWTVEWDTTEFTSMSGDMIVPNTPDAGGTPYVWPGLQPGTTGVLQAVLDGRYGISEKVWTEPSICSYLLLLCQNGDMVDRGWVSYLHQDFDTHLTAF